MFALKLLFVHFLIAGNLQTVEKRHQNISSLYYFISKAPVRTWRIQHHMLLDNHLGLVPVQQTGAQKL